MYLSINYSEDVAAQYAHHFNYERIDHSIVTKRYARSWHEGYRLKQKGIGPQNITKYKRLAKDSQMNRHEEAKYNNSSCGFQWRQ